MEVGEYFERLNVCNAVPSCPGVERVAHDSQSIQTAMRSALSHIRRSRIAPSAINAPPQDFIPPSLGIGLPNDPSSASKNRGLQEEKVDNDAWKGILDALVRLKAERDAEREQKDSNAAEQSNAMEQ